MASSIPMRVHGEVPRVASMMILDGFAWVFITLCMDSFEEKLSDPIANIASNEKED